MPCPNVKRNGSALERPAERRHLLLRRRSMKGGNLEMEKTLRQLIKVDEEKCVNCHACIAACPVKYCIDGSGEKVRVRHELCIGCGSCIRACTHKARIGMDDFESFLEDSAKGKKTIAVLAPAVVARFPDSYLRLNGWLATLGVEAFFDVSFGAELTVESYLRHVRERNPRLVIAQPCPAIVSYLEIYQPQLLPYLAPADSPMLHTIKMVREFYPQWADRKVAVISPCIAKRREFDATGLGDFNVTLENLCRHLEARSVDLAAYPELPFSNAAAERAVLFSAPGGLKETVEREIPGLAPRIRKIEGPDCVYPYFRELPHALERGATPLIVDCLNCEKGCNGGTGTGLQDTPVDILEHAVRMREARQRTLLSGRGLVRSSSAKKIRASVRRFWKPKLYDRAYVDRSANFALSIPTEAEFSDIYRRMRKLTTADFLDCSACGYGSCRDMAIAIHNGLNKPENCKHYDQLVREESKRAVVEMSIALDEELSRSTALLRQVTDALPELSRLTGDQRRSLSDSNARIGDLLKQLKESSVLSKRRQSGIAGLADMAGAVQQELSASLDMVHQLQDRMDGVGGLVAAIDTIASQTNLLSMNAAIEATHAGNSGRGFAVVAAEIRKLADQAATSAAEIGKALGLMTKDIERASRTTEKSGASIHAVLDDLEENASGMQEIFDSLAGMAAQADGVGDLLTALMSAAESVGMSYQRMEESLLSAADKIGSLANFSKDNRRRVERM